MPRRVIVLVLALAAAAGGPHARARDEAEEPGRAFAPAWAGLADTSGWRMRVSAPFPQAWPPPAGGAAVVCYAYAARLRPGLADGEQVASPWARSVEAPDGVTRVTVLGTVLHPLGVQGVRPLRAGEAASAGREPEVAALLRAGNGRATGGLVRAGTCGWMARNGVVAAAIAPLHPAFTRWLACDGTAPGRREAPGDGRPGPTGP